MTGSGPLSRDPSGAFNFKAPAPGWAVYLEPSPKRVRVIVGGETIADSIDAMLLSESGLQPVYYFPPGDVRADVLTPTDHHTHCPKKGDASYFTIRVNDTELVNAAWHYPEVLPDAPPALRGLIAFYFKQMERWLEEDEEIAGHPRDPYHRIDTIASGRRVRVSLGGKLIADTRRAVALFESNLVTRWYLPREDIRAELLLSDTHTICPYKGVASYHSLPGAEDVAWYYPDPLPEASKIRDLVCFYSEKADVEVSV